jgi:hypothetical protein
VPTLPACVACLQWDAVFQNPGAYLRSVRVERGAHTAAVTACSAVGGRLLATASADGSLCLWALPAAPQLAPQPAPRVLCRAQHPGPVSYVKLLNPETAVTACGACAFLWRIETPQPAGAGSSTGARGTRAAAAAAATAAAPWDGLQQGSREFRLVRRIPLESSDASSSKGGSSSGGSGGGGMRIQCAAAWDMYLAAGCGEWVGSCLGN